MKKSLVLLLAVIMAFTCFSTFASAEKLPSNEDPAVVEVFEAKDKDGTNLKLAVEPLDTTKVNLTVFDSDKKELETELKISMEIVDKREVRYEGTGTPEYPITITFKVPGVTASSTGYFLHQKSDNTIEKIKATMGEGTMTGVFNSLSPVAFVVDKDTAVAIKTAKNNTSVAESPKTSSDTATPIAIVLVCMSVALAVFSVKKIKAINR